MIELNKIYNQDCLEGMKEIPDGSVDMILCDLPYGTTACKWDNIIPFEPLWEQYHRVIKSNGAVVLFGSEPFSSKLRMSNLKNYKYDWKWDKKSPRGFLNAKKRPLKRYEDILVFSSKPPLYFPIKEIRGKPRNKMSYNKKKGDGDMAYGQFKNQPSFNNEYYPTDIIEISNAVNKGKVHPTQKPVALFEYLIKTYTNENDTVLDNCMGSGTTAIACMNTKRNFIGFELDKTYFDLANKRMENHNKETMYKGAE